MTSGRWGADPWPDEATAFADHAVRAGRAALSRSEHDVAYRELRAMVDGRASSERLGDVLARLSVFWPPRGDTERPRPASPPLRTRDIAKVALDLAPAAGDDAPRLALGPFAEVLDLLRLPHLRAWTAAVASAAFVPHDDGRPPAKMWTRESHRPPEAERRRLQTVGRAPPSAWRLVAGDGGLHVVPLLPLATAWTPRGAVDVADVGGVDGGPRHGGLLLGRVVVDGDRAFARAAVCLPVVPDAGTVRAWFARLALPQLVAERGLEVEELLRREGHRLWTEAHAWWWVARRAAA